MLDDEAIKELDRDVAEQYYVMNELEVPQPLKQTVPVPVGTGAGAGEAHGNTEETGVEKEKEKKVKFADIDDVEDYEHEKEVKRLQERVWDLVEENAVL